MSVETSRLYLFPHALSLEYLLFPPFFLSVWIYLYFTLHPHRLSLSLQRQAMNI